MTRPGRVLLLEQRLEVLAEVDILRVSELGHIFVEVRLNLVDPLLRVVAPIRQTGLAGSAAL